MLYQALITMASSRSLFLHATIMVLHAVLMLIHLVLMASAGEVKLRWNENPPTDAVISYEVTAREIETSTLIKTIVTTCEAAVQGILPGKPYSYTVTARNLNGVSAPSAPITHTLPPYVRLTIQRSTTLSGWQDTAATLQLPLSQAEFFRLKLETIK